MAIIDIDAGLFEIEIADGTITRGYSLHKTGADLEMQQLRCFLTVVDTGNVTRAADILNRVQPAVSRQLRLLEEDLGVALFERARHGMVLTAAGRAFAVHARRAMLELDRARAELAVSSEGVAGLVTIGLLPSTGDIISSPLLSAIAQEYPKIRLRIAMGYAGDLQQWLEAGDIDAALLYGVEREAQFDVTPLLEEPLWVVGPRSARLNRQKPVPLVALRDSPIILPSGPRGIRTLVDHACTIANVRLTIVAETNAMSLQKSLVLGGHGLTILPPIAFAAELGRKQLSAAPLIQPRIVRTIAIALPTQRPVGQHVRCTTELLVKCARNAVREKGWPEASWLAG